jgi:hypothetical protein
VAYAFVHVSVSARGEQIVFGRMDIGRIFVSGPSRTPLSRDLGPVADLGWVHRSRWLVDMDSPVGVDGKSFALSGP